ncbi:hypothetical protein C0W96_06575 [Photobacterium kishitanii]|uniref:tyrosine-type recombinase/integrase n=1 Tax=Photobacterium kishitanii TaxID=318456 RepID=UPI0005D36F29|nr:tyrosine-type recombinase/integrase [Photobacterium kishitanii]KJG10175.1 hypothetical protein UB40_09010 [Photobacterium kishitanii]PSV06922.1 hypothetical protein C0W96_06575 [Photobacterium kishitanii]PSV78058.1 hypothetical protein C0W29_01660 [Photobacterium kishitanii]
MPITYLKDFQIWDFYRAATKKLQLVDKSNMPYVTYDNGFPCYEANAYLLGQAKKGRSLRINGGTVKTYAKDIHHLVRWCYNNRLPLTKMTDEKFRNFIDYLQEGNVRKNNHVLKIGKQCLHFLEFIGESKSHLTNFIGEGSENAICIEYKTSKIGLGGKKSKEVKSIHHPALPKKSAERRRLPVSNDVCVKLWAYISTQKDILRRFRDAAVYQCLEELGGRVSEIHLITVDSVKAAKKMDKNPYLRLPVLKRQDDVEDRVIPVTHDFLSVLDDYLIRSRKKIIKKTLGKENDHGFLLVSTTTGKQLQSGSITDMMNKWKKKLGITEPLHPHLFRHAFITNNLINLMRQHEINNADEFRNTLLHTEMFKMQLQEWTGHKNIASLDRYIHLAVAHINGYDKAFNVVQLNNAVKTMKRTLASIKLQSTRKEITATEMLMLLENATDAFEMTVAKALSEETNDDT